MELRNNMLNTGNSGTWGVGKSIPAGPPISNSTLVRDGMDQNLGNSIIIPLSQYDGSGYVVCGFAKVTLNDYDFTINPAWLDVDWVKDLIRGSESDPTATDYGARDVRVLK
jgi:hypothetical protein